MLKKYSEVGENLEMRRTDARGIWDPKGARWKVSRKSGQNVARANCKKFDPNKECFPRLVIIPRLLYSHFFSNILNFLDVSF